MQRTKKIKIHVASSREIGDRCKKWAKENGFELVSMQDCEIFVSVLYDTLIPEEYIRTRPCFNFHPGVLPWYRGSGAYSWAIINGEFETGVTLHEIDKDIDHGRVIHIGRFSIWKEDTAEDLFRKAENMIFTMFCKWLHKLVTGDYEAVDQDEGRIYYRKDLHAEKDLTRFIRAFTFLGKESAYYYNARGIKTYIDYDPPITR